MGADYSALASLSSATLHEAAGRIGALPCAIRPLARRMRLCAPAFPVQCAPGSNLALHHAIYAAERGEVLVADVGEGGRFGYWGEVMTVAAEVCGLAGLVINGGVRDVAQIEATDFPVFSAAISLRGTDKNPVGTVGAPIRIGDVPISRGDLIVGDADGVVALPQSRVSEIVEQAHAREADEANYLERLRAGETTLSIYGLPELARAPARPAWRTSVVIDGLSHGKLPIPTASRAGPLVTTGGVRGVDSASGALPADPAEQCRLMFANLRTVVEAAGGAVDDVVKLTIWIAAPEVRAMIDPHWLAMFPDPASRPSRHILNYALSGGMAVQCEATAYIGPPNAGGAIDG